MRLWLTVPLIFGLSECGKDETLSGWGAAGKTWRLIEIDNTPFNARATVEFPKEGEIKGEGPCNAFSAKQLQPYPWFEAADIAATKRACPELEDETSFFTALEEMTLVEVVNETLLLSTPDGREMVFRAQD